MCQVWRDRFLCGIFFYFGGNGIAVDLDGLTSVLFGGTDIILYPTEQPQLPVQCFYKLKYKLYLNNNNNSERACVCSDEGGLVLCNYDLVC